MSATLFEQRFESRAQLASERAFGVTVKLKSGSDESEEITAVFDLQEYESIEFHTGLHTKIRARDYLLKVTDCVIDSVQVEPVAGMFIVDGAIERQILPVPGRPAVELQPGGYRYLVHTKEVSDG